MEKRGQLNGSKKVVHFKQTMRLLSIVSTCLMYVGIFPCKWSYSRNKALSPKINFVYWKSMLTIVSLLQLAIILSVGIPLLTQFHLMTTIQNITLSQVWETGVAICYTFFLSTSISLAPQIHQQLQLLVRLLKFYEKFASKRPNS